MARPLTFGERVERLEAAFRRQGKTQADLADSFGVSTRTVRRWKKRTDAPETKFGGKAETKKGFSKLRRRERTRDLRVPKQTDVQDLPDAGEELMDRPFDDETLGGGQFLAQVTASWPDNPTVRRAAELGAFEKVELRVVAFDPFSGEEGLDTTFTLPLLGPGQLVSDFVGAAWSEFRLLVDRTGDSDWDVRLASVVGR